MQSFDQTMTPFSVLEQVGNAIEMQSRAYAIATIENAARYFEKRRIAQGKRKSAYVAMLQNLVSVMNTGFPAYSVFSEKGNSKLPFVAFSALPGKAHCPGAGDHPEGCLNFCYSFRAWRMPAAFGRQAQNSILRKYYPQRIVESLDSIMAMRKFSNGLTLRLYVDGDFNTLSDFAFWQGVLHERQNIKAYGYSKSFDIILAYAQSGATFAPNYVLNVSSGHRYDESTVKRIGALPITRGSFVAVQIKRTGRKIQHDNPEHRRNVQTALKGSNQAVRAFACPGLCGSCTSTGHACGSMKFKGINIGIAVH